MKEIKFRAWDVQKNVMVEWDEIEKSNFISILIRSNNGNSKNLKLMQYIGMKDKNNKEIYEGDVVEWEGYEVRNGKQIRPTRKRIVEDFIYDSYCIRNILSTNNTVEVVGNIYETEEKFKND